MPESVSIEHVVPLNAVVLPDLSNILSPGNTGSITSLSVLDEQHNIYTSDLNCIRSAVLGGSNRWDFCLPDGELFAVPTYDQGMLFAVTSSGHLYAINANNGDMYWRFDNSNPAFVDNAMSGIRRPVDLLSDAPLVFDGKVYFVGLGSELYGLNRDDGSFRYEAVLSILCTNSIPLY